MRYACLGYYDEKAFEALPKAEQDSVDAVGLRQWADWEERNAASIADRGGMVGKRAHERDLRHDQS